MNYMLWRLHRNQLLVAAVALIVLTVVLLILPRSANHSIEAIDYATIVVPLLLGVFWGAPLLAKEFEDGTNGLAWTQGVTRRHWLRRNLMWALLAGAVFGAAVTSIVTWWSLAEVSLGRSRLGPGPFDIQGIVPVAYSIFAVALGVAVGSLVRRVLPAMGTTLAALVGVRIVIAVVIRPHFMSPVSKVVSLAQGLPAGAWLLSSPVSVGRSGTLLTYQPADRFWVFQGVEAGIFILLAAGLVAFAFRMVVARDA